mmetsp:Transcript_18529/g.65941  ORF Transcript_18529/g.65941 Transcript_18529/m.65941 type:complete len:264 (-) Transcript_18529:66-857(-)
MPWRRVGQEHSPVALPRPLLDARRRRRQVARDGKRLGICRVDDTAFNIKVLERAHGLCGVFDVKSPHRPVERVELCGVGACEAESLRRRKVRAVAHDDSRKLNYTPRMRCVDDAGKRALFLPRGVVAAAAVAEHINSMCRLRVPAARVDGGSSWWPASEAARRPNTDLVRVAHLRRQRVADEQDALDGVSAARPARLARAERREERALGWPPRGGAVWPVALAAFLVLRLGAARPRRPPRAGGRPRHLELPRRARAAEERQSE